MIFDFIVVGSGLAGLTSSLVLKDKGTVALLSKSSLIDTATNLAQGGICAVVEEDDSYQSHIRDTLVAGVYHNNKKAVEYMVKDAPLAIDWLVKRGVRFDKKNSHYSATKEAAHSHNRVLHATDFTGREIERALAKEVKRQKDITVWEDCFVTDLLVRRNKCCGVQVIRNGNFINFFSRATVLSTGGLGQIYLWTTNPEIATGDGLAMAYRKGGTIVDLEFVQFHPTALRHGKSPLFLLSEALRGEGAYLVDNKGERFMKDIHPKAELAPRDIVARAIFQKQQNGNNIFLDIRYKGKPFLKKRFPNIYKEVRKRGFDLASNLVPVTPAAHYSCGGIKTDVYGRTEINNLFAYGEVSCAGVHGANRLASNSLLEAAVFPRRLLDCVNGLPDRVYEEQYDFPEFNDDFKIVKSIKERLKNLMWEKAGIIRRGGQLHQALTQVDNWEKEIAEIKGINRNSAELRNMLLVSKLIITAGLKRKISLGAHFNMD